METTSTDNGTRYIYRKLPDRVERVHRLVAVKALGKPLPPRTEIHHVDGDKGNNANGNLVICPDHGYHELLHARTKVVRSGGNPNTQKWCDSCGQSKDFSAFCRHSRAKLYGLRGACKDCTNALQREQSRRDAVRRSGDQQSLCDDEDVTQAVLMAQPHKGLVS